MGLIRVIFLVIGVVVLTTRCQCADNGALSSRPNLENTVERLEKIISKMEKKLNQQQQTILQMKENAAKYEDTLDELTREVKDITVRQGASGVVAFNARRNTDYGPVSIDTQIIYPTMDLSEGSPYDVLTGDFTAPVTGIYFIYFIHEHENTNTFTFLKINGITKQEVVTGDSLDSGTGFITVKLQLGDIVKVYLWGNDIGSLRCDGAGGECMFGGFLLYEII